MTKENKIKIIEIEIEKLSKIQLFNPRTGHAMYRSEIVNEARKQIRGLKIELDTLINPPKSLSVDIVENIINQNNGQLRQCDLDATDLEILKEMLIKTNNIEKEALQENPNLYSDENGGGPASFYHIQYSLQKAIEKKLNKK